MPRPENAGCLPRLKMGCCCCTLTTCCKVQGWLSVIGSVLMMIRYLVGTIGAFVTVPNMFGECSSERQKLDADLCAVLRLAVVVQFVAIAYCILVLVIAIYFLKGINQKKPEWMVHFIRLMWVNMVCSVLLMGFELYAAANAGGGAVALVLVWAAASVGISFYCLLCANSLYQDIIEENDSREDGKLGVVVTHSASPPPYDLVKN